MTIPGIWPWPTLLALAGALALPGCRREPAPVIQPSLPVPAAPSPPPAERPGEATPAPLLQETPPPQPTPARDVEMVTIKLQVTPPKLAHVIWGVKDLGVAPLQIRRPRGSGPMDLILRAPGFLTHHTRVFTDRDDTLSIRLGPENEASSVFGYQAPPEKILPNAKAKPGTKPPR